MYFNNNIFRCRPAYSAKMADSSTNSSYTVQAPEHSATDTDQENESVKVLTTKSSSLLSPKKADFLSPSRKSDREKVFIDDGVEKSTVSSKVAALPLSTTSGIKSANTLPQQSSSKKSTNVFSARDMGVVSPVKEMLTNDKDEMVRKNYKFEFLDNFRLLIL